MTHLTQFMAMFVLLAIGFLSACVSLGLASGSRAAKLAERERQREMEVRAAVARIEARRKASGL